MTEQKYVTPGIGRYPSKRNLPISKFKQSGTTDPPSLYEMVGLYFERVITTAMLKRIKEDIRVVFERDPAAKSVFEVVMCYPGLHAIWLHRIAHAMYKRRWVLLPRLVANFSRFLTGIDIHPGARLGEGLFIDHGMGVVIGETAELGRNVTLFQGVTLGGTGKEKGKRHPTIGNNVVIASGAKVLGSFTVGDRVKIGAGSVVLQAVPPNSTVVGIPGRVVVRDGQKITDQERETSDMEHDKLPDPVAEILLSMQKTIEQMENRIIQLEEEKNNGTTSI